MSVVIQVLMAIGRFLMQHLGALSVMAGSIFLLDSEWFMGLATEVIGWLRPVIPSLVANIQTLQGHVSTQWAAAVPYLSMANSVVPIDYALTLAGILFALWLTVLGVRVSFSIRNLIRK